MIRNLCLIFALLPKLALAADWGQLSLMDVGRDEDGENWIGLKFEMNDGWKTYWKYAGQNGLDPIIEVTQDGEAVTSSTHWPEPHLFIADGLPSVGYKGEFVLPISLVADGEVQIHIDFGVCETVCVPVTSDFSYHAQAGYSIEQYILKGAPKAKEAAVCDWKADDLSALDPEKYWMFVEDTGFIAHYAPEDFSNGAIYELHAEGIKPLPCP